MSDPGLTEPDAPKNVCGDEMVRRAAVREVLMAYDSTMVQIFRFKGLKIGKE